MLPRQCQLEEVVGKRSRVCCYFWSFNNALAFAKEIKPSPFYGVTIRDTNTGLVLWQLDQLVA